jgi:Zn-dependent protease
MISGLITLAILIYSAVLHEIAHGYVAARLGDPTARMSGRLTLNPLKHLDPLGSVLLPLLMFVSGSRFLFGWAKPVPVNENYFADPKRDMMKCALAGPLTNYSLAFAASIIIKTVNPQLWLENLLAQIVWLNILLGTFNLIPLPPLDGSRILAYFLPPAAAYRFYQLEPYGPIIILVLLYLGALQFIMNFLMPLFNWLM